MPRAARSAVLFVTLTALAACGWTQPDAAPVAAPAPSPSDDLPAPQWAQGTAELCRYELTRQRYGEPRTGDAILIFVEEEYLPVTQVKFEGKRVPGESPVKVLKLNDIRRFTTGVYDYSLMRSVFTPRTRPDAAGRTLKVTASAQDWCGHSWTQLTRDARGVRAIGHSYFQREGESDQSFAEPAYLEDGLWTLIRLDPDALPVGRVSVIPGVFHHRLTHTTLDVEPARAAWIDAPDGRRRYQLSYDGGRIVELEIDAAAPYRLQAFRESFRDSVAVEGTLTHTTSLPYWSHNGADDIDLRAALGLSAK